MSRPGCADTLGADVQAVGIDAEMRGSACDAEPGPHCQWYLPSAALSFAAAEEQNLVEMLLRARRVLPIGVAAPHTTGVDALMQVPTSAMLVCADRAITMLELEHAEQGGRCDGIKHHDTRVGFVVADALGFVEMGVKHAELFGKRIGTCRVAAVGKAKTKKKEASRKGRDAATKSGADGAAIQLAGVQAGEAANARSLGGDNPVSLPSGVRVAAMSSPATAPAPCRPLLPPVPVFASTLPTVPPASASATTALPSKHPIGHELMSSSAARKAFSNSQSASLTDWELLFDGSWAAEYDIRSWPDERIAEQIEFLQAKQELRRNECALEVRPSRAHLTKP